LRSTDEQGLRQVAERVARAAGGQAQAHEALERGQGEEAGRQLALGPRQHVRQAAPAPEHVLADGPHEQAEARAGQAKCVAREQHAAPEVQRIVAVLVEDAIDLAGPDTAGQQRGDDRPGAAADVDVEGRALAVEPLLERRHRAHLVHTANDAAAGERQGVAGLAADRGRLPLPEIPGPM